MNCLMFKTNNEFFQFKFGKINSTVNPEKALVIFLNMKYPPGEAYVYLYEIGLVFLWQSN